MKYAVIDTETSGLFDFSKPADAEGQPRLAELAMLFWETGEPEISAFTHIYVEPEGWTMAPEMEAVNGLTQDFLAEHGQPLAAVLALYTDAIKAGYIVVAHNAQYDTKVMRGELRRLGLPDLFEMTPNICTMRAATQICAIPKKNGKGVKFPKLEEAYRHFQKADMPPLEGPGKALRDAHACLAVLQALDAAQALPPAEVHYAKVRPEPIAKEAV